MSASYRRVTARYGRWPLACLLGLLLAASLLLLLPAFAWAFLSTDDGTCLCQGPEPPGDPLTVLCFLDAAHGWAVCGSATLLTAGCSVEIVSSGTPAPEGRAFAAASVGRPPPPSE